MGRGYGAYFNQLFNTNLRWQFWAIGFAALLLFFAIGKMRTAVFFQMYTFVTFLPLIFLVNRREAFYWYVPILGLYICDRFLSRNRTRRCSSSHTHPFLIRVCCTTPLKWRSAGRISMRRWLRPNRVECAETRNRAILITIPPAQYPIHFSNRIVLVVRYPNE